MDQPSKGPVNAITYLSVEVDSGSATCVNTGVMHHAGTHNGG